jgi:hypothetical protein
MNAETLKAKLAAIPERHCARFTGNYDLARQWARGISTVELETQLEEAERDLKPITVARIGKRVVKLDPVPPDKVNWARALRDELASRSDRQSIRSKGPGYT